MPRIAMIVSNPCINDARVIKMAGAAAAAGNEVHVFGTLGTDTPSYDKSTEITFHRLEWRPLDKITQAFPIAQLMMVPWIGRMLGLAVAKRLVPYLKYRLFSWVFAGHIAEIEPDIVHAHDLICLKAGNDAANACGAKLVYDAHELEVYRNPPLSMLQKCFVYYVQRKYGHSAAEVITVGDMVGEVLAKHLGRSDINIVYNSPIINACQRHLRDELEIGASTPLVVYVGKVTSGRGIIEIVRLLTRMNRMVLAAVGPCDETQRRSLQRVAERLGVDGRFRILPPVPFDEVVDYIRGADLGVISVEPITLSYQYCMPNKLFELAFAGVPIISNDLDDIAKFLRVHQNGEIVDFKNRPELIYKVATMIGEKGRYTTTGSVLESMKMKYSWEAQAITLKKIYQRALCCESTTL